MPEGSILVPILFDIFIIDFFIWCKKLKIHNFENDNTITCFSETTENLKEESQEPIRWCESNKMIVITRKFWAIIINKNGQ